jgi:hypothetical protein
VAFDLGLWLCAIVTAQLQDVKKVGGFVVVSAIDKQAVDPGR